MSYISRWVTHSQWGFPLSCDWKADTWPLAPPLLGGRSIYLVQTREGQWTQCRSSGVQVWTYLQTTAAHCIHDGGVVDDFVWYPSIHCSQHQVTVGGGSAGWMREDVRDYFQQQMNPHLVLQCVSSGFTSTETKGATSSVETPFGWLSSQFPRKHWWITETWCCWSFLAEPERRRGLHHVNCETTADLRRPWPCLRQQLLPPPLCY